MDFFKSMAIRFDMPLLTSVNSLSHSNFLPWRGSVNSPNQWKSLEARSGLLRGLGSNSHLNSRNIASWHKDQSNPGVVFLSAAAQPILHKPSFPALHELIFANFHDLSLIVIIFLTLRMLFAYLHQVDSSQDRYLCESWLLLEHYIFQRLFISCKAAQPATHN